jgi:hypothetical protein
MQSVPPPSRSPTKQAADRIQIALTRHSVLSATGTYTGHDEEETRFALS